MRIYENLEYILDESSYELYMINIYNSYDSYNPEYIPDYHRVIIL